MTDLKPNISVTSINVNGFNPYNYMGKISKGLIKPDPAIWYIEGSPGGSDSKESACKQETWVQCLGWEDPLEKGMAINILAWRIPWTEEPGRLQTTGSQRVWQDSETNTFYFTFVSKTKSF